MAPELRAPVLAGAAYYWWNLGKPDEAKQLAGEALREGIVATSTYPAATHSALMAIEISSGNPQAAIEVGNAIRGSLQSLHNPFTESNILGSLAIWEAMAGDLDQSRADAARSLELARRSQNPYSLANALHANTWAHQRDDSAAALHTAEQCLEIHRRSPVNMGSSAGVLALAAGMRSRVGDSMGALSLLRESVVIARDQGARPQLASALDWALSPLTKIGRPEPAAVFVGALIKGSLTGVGDFPGVNSARMKALERVRSAIGDDRTDAMTAHGAAMSYDEIVEYALTQLQTDEEY